MKFFVIYAAGLLLSGWASGALAAPICDGVYDNEPAAMKLGIVVGHPPRLLMATPSDCRPNEKGCRSSDILAPGTLVTSFQSAEGFVCVEAAPDRGRRRWGWLPEGNLRAAPERRPTPARWWVGQWYGGGYNRFSISLEGGVLEADGYAESGPHNNPRFGGFGGAGVQAAGSLAFLDVNDDEGDDERGKIGCYVRLVRFGSQIAVVDNEQCGAMTRVSGFYRRTSDIPVPKG